MGAADEAVGAHLRWLEDCWGWTRAAGEWVELGAKEASSGRWNSQAVLLADVARGMSCGEAGEGSAQGWDVYIGACGLTERVAGRRRGGRAVRGRAGALWLDVDCAAPGREGEAYFPDAGQAVAGVDEALGEELAAAAWVLGSGWGVQYWWPFAGGGSVEGGRASAMVRALVEGVGRETGRRVDRVWDTTRVMRLPGTWNWRGGPGGAVLSGDVVRQPGGALSAGELESALEQRGWTAAPVRARGQHPVGGGPGGGEWALLDVAAAAQAALSWEDVLRPWGWTSAGDGVWSRPGREGERSGVVYQDRPDLLVVYSDSPATGLWSQLRGSGARGDGAGVGVVSKWGAWVDLAWRGDRARAEECVLAGGGAEAGGGAVEAAVAQEMGPGTDLAERLVAAWLQESQERAAGVLRR